MNTLFIYPGSFSPPTKGHFNVVQRAAEILPHLYVVCSVNSKKSNMFSMEESKKLWQSYNLPDNVSVLTYNELVSKNHNLNKIIIIRGLRDSNDFVHEQGVMDLNWKKFGIDKYLFFLCDREFKNTSSSRVRVMAGNMELEKLSDHVSPLVISALIEKTLGVENIFLVVGRPASGKSTFMKMLATLRRDVYYINTDSFNEKLKPLLRKKFACEDLVNIAVNRGDELKEVIREPWLKLLKESLLSSPPKANIFVEAAFGLQADKPMYKILGGKIIYLGCKSADTNIDRVRKRKTEQVLPFVEKIPGQKESKQIAQENKLRITCVNTDGDIQKLEKTAKAFVKKF